MLEEAFEETMTLYLICWGIRRLLFDTARNGLFSKLSLYIHSSNG